MIFARRTIQSVRRRLKTNSFYAKISPGGKRIAGNFPANDIYVADARGEKETNITGRK